MGDRLEIAEALAKAAREIDSQHDHASTLDAIVHTAARSLPDIDHAGITIAHHDGRIETRAGTDPLVWELDALQQELDEGPSVHVLTVDEVTTVNHLRRETRWPQYVPRAVERGLKAQMGLRLYVEDETLGGLNLYSTRTEVIDPEVAQMAVLFATHAALALGRVRQEENLHTALHTRKLIGQAVGIVMERFTLGEAAAFAYLTRVSQHSNTRLRDIAEELVSQAEERAKRTG
ncbi:MAG: GAF and ANTAR domain-containing protein [Nocardioides sp.]